MTAVLIDMLVHPLWVAPGQLDAETLGVQARARGLDGLAVVGEDVALDLTTAQAAAASAGVHLFNGVALHTDGGRVVAYPRQVDAWFLQGGWRESAHRDEGDLRIYEAASLLPLLAAHGAVIIAFADDEDGKIPQGASGVWVLGGANGRGLAETTARQAQVQRMACVGGTDGAATEARFGTAATVFAAAPADQHALAEALQSGRCWPAEIGFVAARPAAAPARDATTAAEPRAPRPEPAKGADSSKAKQPKKPAGRYDVAERPGDNRGNRLNREEVLRALWLPSAPQEEAQPSADPIAIMYGLDGRKQQRYRDKSDVELDRLVNGNRAKGADPNIMAMPNFDEMRHDRVQIHLLFAPSEEQHDLEDSIALRFALSHVRRADDGTLMLQGNPLDRGRSQRPMRHGPSGQHGHRRRR